MVVVVETVLLAVDGADVVVEDGVDDFSTATVVGKVVDEEEEVRVVGFSDDNGSESGMMVTGITTPPSGTS